MYRSSDIPATPPFADQEKQVQGVSVSSADQSSCRPHQRHHLFQHGAYTAQIRQRNAPMACSEISGYWSENRKSRRSSTARPSAQSLKISCGGNWRVQESHQEEQDLNLRGQSVQGELILGTNPAIHHQQSLLW